MSDGWTVFVDTDAYENRNAKVMSAKDIEKVKRVCLREGFGGFITWKGNAMCRRMQPATLEVDRVPMKGATLYIAPTPDSSGTTFGGYYKRGDHLEPGWFYDSEGKAFEALFEDRNEFEGEWAEFADEEEDIEARTPEQLSGMRFPPESLELDSNGLPLLRMCNQNTLISASDIAFSRHLPLVLTPDTIWLTIVAGLSLHVNKHAEELRSKFVSHEGKVNLKVLRNEFVKGAHNDWKGVFSEWSQQVRRHVGKATHNNLVPHFTTSTSVTRAACEAMLLNMLQNYFEYECMTECGIPSFTVEGTPADWRDMQRRVKYFLVIDESLSWWTEPLLEVLKELELACLGEPSEAFWRKWYKEVGASGGPYISGAVLALFPYLLLETGPRRNESVGAWREADWEDWEDWEEEGGDFEELVLPKDFPSSVAVTDFTWDVFGTKYPMKFCAGLCGHVYDKEKGIRPIAGWVVSEAV